MHRLDKFNLTENFHKVLDWRKISGRKIIYRQ